MKKILLIENDQMILENTTSFLKGEGFKVYQCSDVHDAMQTVNMVNPDIVISSLSAGTPEFDLCKSLKASQSTSLIPIIYLTSNSTQVQFGMQIGADDLLPKPFSYSQLLATINSNIIDHYSLVPVFINTRLQARK